MYSDRDGTATKQSQMVYDKQKRLFCLAIGLISSIGFSAVAIVGEYSRPTFESSLDSCWKVNWHHAGPLLWVGPTADAGLIAQDDMPLLTTAHSPFSGLTALFFGCSKTLFLHITQLYEA